MATEYQIKFFKGAYGLNTETTGAIARSNATPGGIFFDTTSRTICVGGLSYGGNIQDVTFSNGMLTITKASGDNVTLDFSDTASATATLKVFHHMNDLIGVTNVGTTTALSYSGTTYISTSTTLVDADKKLDAAITAVDTRINGMDASNIETVAISSSNGDVTLTFKGVSETDGIVEVGTRGDNLTIKKVGFTGKAEDVSYDNTTSGMDATTAQAAIDELKDSITNANITIDGYKGGITSDANTMVPVAADGGKIGVKTDNVYIGSSSNGVTLLHVDTDASSSTGSDLATVNTVTAHISTAIDALDVTEYAQAEIAGNGESFSVYGIKEEDGKISKGTNAVTLNFGSVYDATNNKVALVSNITDAINDLDVTSPVQAVTASDTNNVIVLTMTGVEEEDGKIKQGTGIGTVTFAKVAKTGAAADVTLAAANTPYVGSNVDETIVNVDSRIKALEELPKFDTVVCENAADTPAGVTWGTDPTVTGTLVASNSTMHKIYLVPATGTAVAPNTYAEYITVKNGSNYIWEKVGDTATDLTGYVRTITVNGKQYAITNNTTDVALGNVVTSVVDGDNNLPTTGGYTSDYIQTEVTASTLSTAADGSRQTTVTSAGAVKVQAVATADSSNMGLAEASDVKAYIGSRVQDLNVNETPVTGTNVSFKYKETNGIVEIGTLQVDYASVSVNTTAVPSLTVTDGTKLAVGSDIDKVRQYVDAKISTSINALDASVTSTETTIATVQVVEENGKITEVHVTAQDAQVSYTPSVDTTTAANIESGRTTGALTGADIATIKQYVDDKASQASQTEVSNAGATIPVNVGTDPEVILGTVAGTAITAKASFTWEEYA